MLIRVASNNPLDYAVYSTTSQTQQTQRMIRKLDINTSSKLRSSHSITSLVDVVKELVENSIDAGSTRIRVVFGARDRLEVIDNGAGIALDDHDRLAKRHMTSKIDNFASLSLLCTLGFRGEALSALCSVAKLSIVTRARTDVAAGRLVGSSATLLEFDARNEIVNRQTLVVDSRLPSSGTVMIVDALFAELPVRRQYMRSNEKQQAREIESLIHHYGLICALCIVFFHPII
jgi:DNA mismatch repair protein PMS2